VERKSSKGATPAWGIAARRRNMGKETVVATATTTTVAAMDCVEFDRLLAEALRRDDLPLAARLHLDDCPACAAKLDDFEAIAQSVRQLSASLTEPVPNQWPQIRLALLREGIIHPDGNACVGVPAPRLVRKR